MAESLLKELERVDQEIFRNARKGDLNYLIVLDEKTKKQIDKLLREELLNVEWVEISGAL